MRKSSSFLDVFRFVAGYWCRQPWKFAAITVSIITMSLLDTYLPTLLSNLINAINQKQGKEAILLCLGKFLGAYFVKAIGLYISYCAYNIFETRIFQQLSNDAFRHICRLPERYFINTFTGSIVSKISRARQRIETFEDQVILKLLPMSVILVGSTIFLAVRFPLLAALMMVYVATLIGVSAWLTFRISGPARGIYADAQDAYVAHLADSIGGISTMKSYASESRENSHFTEITSTLREKCLRAYILGNHIGGVQSAMVFGMLVLLLGGGAWYLLKGEAGIEDIAYLALAYTILQAHIREMGRNINDLLNSSYDLHAVIELLSQQPEAGSDLPALTINQGAITFENVTFAYPGKAERIFNGLSVSIHPGERIALVGHSGSGKTTFIRLLQCHYQPQEGRVLIDGQNIANGSPDSLRRAIAVVPQDPILFHRSLYENVAYGQPAATLGEVRTAAKQAHIEHFIEGLPEQYETLVGERGIKLSGGERQRVAIARAILVDRPILILDEATSSLDSESERAIQDALRVLTHGRTSIMIAHRLSTILDADRILVFDQGQIVEDGTHAELVEKVDGIYAGFFSLQSEGFSV